MSGEGERYEEFEPPAALRPFVRTIWTYAASAPAPPVQRIAPAGCPELVVDIGAPYEEQGPDGVFRLQPRALFAGQMTRPLAMRPVGPIELVAVRFEPDGARDWLGAPLAQATDRRLNMVERLAGIQPPAGDPAAQVEMMTRWLEDKRRAADWSLDSAVRAELEIAERDEPPPVRSPAEHRALQRRFRDRVGVPRACCARSCASAASSITPRGRRRPGGWRRVWEPGISINRSWLATSVASSAAPLRNGPANRSGWRGPSRRNPTSPGRCRRTRV